METGWPLLSEVRGLNAFLRHTMQSVSSWCFQTLSSTAGCHLLSHGNTAEDKIVSKAADISSYIFLRIFFLKLPLSFGFDTLYIYIYTHTYTYIYTYIHTHICVCIYIYMFEKSIHAWVLCFWNLKHLTKMRKWSCPFFTVQRHGHWNMCTLTVTPLGKFGNLTYDYGTWATCTRFLQPNHGNQ